MNKCKLIQIIEKELEELKVLTEEVAASEKDTSLIIEIALSKARLLCQEMELLRELSAKEKSLLGTNDLNENEEEQMYDDDVSDESISDPELEIINSDNDLNFDNVTEEDDDLENDTSAVEFGEDEDNDETEDEDNEELIEFGEHKDSTLEKEEEPLVSIVKEEENELKMEKQAGIREMELDDDDDPEPLTTQPAPGITEHPVMHEIPKPEAPATPKNISAESFPKSPSLNDSISETKSPETTLANGPITSLRAAIGLNDRFSFIREIFANNTEKYNTIIDQLDKLETQQQAVELLKANLTLQKNETSMKFVDLLKRRFSK